MKQPGAPEATIELRIESLAHFFDPFDPFPAPSRDLSKTAEEFIIGWARDLPRRAALSIRIYLSEADLGGEQAAGLAEAIGRHFTAKAVRVRGDVHELFKLGRASLAVGLCVLGICLLLGRGVEGVFGQNPITGLFAEGLIILGWVANWRPIEIFFYDWWPLVQRRKLFERLAAAPVDIRVFEARGGAAACGV